MTTTVPVDERAGGRSAGETRHVTVTAKEARTFAASRTPWRLVLAPLLAAAALAALALGVNAAFAERALPRLTVGGVEVGALPASELRDRLVQEIARPWAAAAVVVRGPDGLEWTTTNEALAIAPDVDVAVMQALSYGHTGSPVQRIVAWMDALEGRAAVPFAMRADGAAADEWVRAIVAGVDRPASDGAITPTLLGIDVTPAVVGRSVDGAALRRSLVASSALGDRDIALPLH
jgi:hypothetical protein